MCDTCRVDSHHYATGLLHGSVSSLINIELDPEQIATKGFIAFSSSTMYIKQHIKSVPTLKHHKGSDYDVEEMIVHTKMELLELGVLGYITDHKLRSNRDIVVYYTIVERIFSALFADTKLCTYT